MNKVKMLPRETAQQEGYVAIQFMQLQHSRTQI